MINLKPHLTFKLAIIFLFFPVEYRQLKTLTLLTYSHKKKVLAVIESPPLSPLPTGT